MKPIVCYNSQKNTRKIHSHVTNHAMYKNKIKNHQGKLSNKQKILNHFNSCFLTNESEKLSNNLFKRCKNSHFLYLMNEDVGKIIINSISNELLEGNKCIIEANPGFGFITKHLISLDCLKIKVFEPDPYFKDYIKNIELCHPDKLDVYNKNLSYLFKSGLRGKEGPRINLQEVIRPMELKEWGDECSIKIIGSCPNNLFLRQYVMNIIFQKEFFQFGRPQLFFLLNPKIYAALNPQNNIMKTFPILFNIFFDIDYVLSVDRRDFLPWFDIKLSKSFKKYIISDIDQMILVRITGKKDLLERIGGAQNLISLWFFLTQLCKSTRNRVIPSIEKWIPGLGYRLLLSGIDTFTEIRDLNPGKLLDLFLIFSSWPEIHDSPYSSALESFTVKKITGNSSDHEEELSQEEDESLSEIDLEIKDEES